MNIVEFLREEKICTLNLCELAEKLNNIQTLESKLYL